MGKVIALSESQDFNQAALDNHPDGIIWTEFSGEIVYLNAAASELYGYTADQMLGKLIFDLTPNTDYETWKTKWHQVLDVRELHQPCRLLTKAGKVSHVDTIARCVRLGTHRYIAFYLTELSEGKDPAEMLRIISEGTASVVGGDFFRSLAYHLVHTIGIRYAIITECANVAKTRLRTLVYIERGNFLDNFEYELSGTPCEIVMNGKQYYCESGLEHIFPKEEGVQSYFAVPIYLSDGEVAGHIAIFDTQPLRVSQQQVNIMRIFASRAGAEIERKRKDEIIQDNVVRYRNLFEDSPIGLSEDDLFEVKKYIEGIKRKGISDLQKYLDENPGEIHECHNRVIRLNVNKAMLKLFGFTTQREYIEAFSKFFQPDVFKEVLVALDSGQPVYEREVTIKRPNGENRYIIAKRAILPGYEQTWSKSIASCVDITEQKLAQLNLKKALTEVRDLKEKLEAENIYLQEEIQHDHNFNEIVCQSEVFANVLEKVQQVANTDATVLILGESGTGKELIARAIHSSSNRTNRALVKINCAALPANLIESELFGHEKGAFTGAITQKPGRFELADGGTIFLDEIGELPLDLQAKLLRVLQEGEFERLGSSKTIKVDVRIIAATNRDLEKAAAAKEFRADLFYRLNVFPIVSPPLRERKEDIPVLVNHFCKKYSAKIGKKIKSISKKTLDAMMAYDWPGNVRELENIVERGLIISRGDSLELGDWLPVSHTVTAQNKIIESNHKNLSLEEIERMHILNVLETTGWKIRGEDGAAKKLGLNPTTLEARMKKLGIQRTK